MFTDEYGNLNEGRTMLLIFILIGVIFIIILIPVMIIVNIGGSRGEHTGLITAVESNDNILWDANLIYFKSSDETTQEEAYCINENLLEKAKELSSKKQIVTISFKNDFWFMRWDCNGGISIVYNLK